METTVGHFADKAAADAAYQQLLQEGFARDDISLIGPGREGEHGLAKGDTVTTGGAATIGIIEGLLLGAVAMLIPGFGPVVAVGPVAAALTGVVTGGVTGLVIGGIAGALIHAGVAEDTARYYEDRMRQGGLLMTVQTDAARAAEARRALEKHGADVRGSRVGA
ncbi:MAG TPA: hypothetical protein VII06_06420 [Chloroflexota bacterium]|jgi:hypothetical protein